jgi:hypothetical protein
VSKQYLEKKSIEEIIANIKWTIYSSTRQNAWLLRIARACYKRLVALDNEKLVYEGSECAYRCRQAD